MRDCPVWAEIKDRFEPDGSLRDVYVLKTNRSDWEKFIAFVRSSPVAPVMRRDDQPIPVELPSDFPHFPEDAIRPRLEFVIAGLECRCHFFGDEEIEFDINPAEMKGEHEYEALVSFLGRLRDVMNRDVVLTEENCNPDREYWHLPEAVILRLAANRGSI